MNREFLLESVLGIGLGVLVALLIAGSAKRPGATPRGVVVGGLVFVLIALPTLLESGMTITSLVLFLLLLLVPLASALLVSARGRQPAGEELPARLLQGLVAVGLTSVVLIAAGQALSLFALVNYTAVVVVVAATATLVVLVSGLAGTDTLGRWVAWLLLLPLVIIVAIALVLGSWVDLGSPAVIVDPAGPGVWFALAAVFAVLGAAHPTLRRYAGDLTPSVVLKAALGVLGIVVLFGVSMLLALGGAVVGPSLQLFTLPSNLNIIPGPVLIFAVFLTLLYVAMAAGILLGSSPEKPELPRVLAVAVLSVVVSVVGLGLERVAIVTALAAAVLLGSRLVPAGAAALVAVVVLELTGSMRFDWMAAVAIIAVAVVGAVAGTRSAQPEPANLP